MVYALIRAGIVPALVMLAGLLFVGWLLRIPGAPFKRPLPKSQAYFWTDEWQADEAIADAEIAAGELLDALPDFDE